MPVRRRQPRRQETGAAERYRDMGIAAALARPWDYPTACGELAALLRLGYAELPKAAQALVAADVLLAFRLLPDVQTGYSVTAANNLLQAAEAALPKQKKAQAASEFKHYVVAHKRRAKVQQETCSQHIPHDVLVHIFSFLDMRSLVSAGLVCWYFSSRALVPPLYPSYFYLSHFFFLRRSWNSAVVDNDLWRMNYSLFFGTCYENGISVSVSRAQNIYGLAVQNSMDSVSIDQTFCWKEIFHKKYAECATWRFASNRALCGHCRSVIWLSNLTRASPHHCPKNGKGEIKLRPLLPETAAEYILLAEDLEASSSDSDDADSDSNDEHMRSRFWLL